MDVVLLRQSFEVVVAREPTVLARFYEILFERYPVTRAMFGRNSIGAQEAMLGSALTSVLDHLESAYWLTQTLESLGARHIDYGVRDEMYDWVGECLLAALAEAGGDAWTDAVAAAWTEAFGFIATTMKAGAARARSAA